MMRFNEAIDQALAESIAFFSDQVDEARNLFLGMVGHDMRGPIQTVQMTAAYLVALNAGSKVSEAGERLAHSGSRMRALIEDLVDFNRIKLGLGIDVSPARVDLSEIFTREVNQLRAANPGREITLEVPADLSGMCDAGRLQQLLTNLVRNAIQYGEPDLPVIVTVKAGDTEVRIDVRNRGPVISESELGEIFEPLKRGTEQESKYTQQSNLGLGLYIVREIAKAHGGSVTARSDANETVFTVLLPRQPGAAAA
jgi:signal transduction histidine kinase